MSVRPAAVSNQFYPGDASVLRQTVLGFLGRAEKKSLEGSVKAVIAPHAGYIYSGEVAAYAYKLLGALDQERMWKILLLGPAHHVPFSGAAAPVHDEWETPLGNVAVRDIRKEIPESDVISDIPDAGVMEHSLEVQVPFLQTVLKNFVVYPLVLGNLRADFLAEDLEDFCKKDDVVVVVSSDLSHFLEYDEAKRVDRVTSEAICDLDLEKMLKDGDACGKNGILVLMNLAKTLGWECRILDYKNSGDTAGDKSRVVGYGAYGFYATFL